MRTRRSIVCATCGGLVCLCVHCEVAKFIEAANPHERPAAAAFNLEGLPPEPDDSHQDYDRSEGIEQPNLSVSGPSSDDPPFAGWNTTNTAVIAHYARRNAWHPAYYSGGHIRPLLPPDLIVSSGSSPSA